MSLAVPFAVLVLAILGLAVALYRHARAKADPDGPRTVMPGMRG